MEYQFRKTRLFSVVSVSLLHFSILLALGWASQTLRGVNILSVTFWFSALSTLICYYKCCFLDPGFQTTCVSDYLPIQEHIADIKARAAEELAISLQQRRQGGSSGFREAARTPADDLIQQVLHPEDENEGDIPSYVCDNTEIGKADEEAAEDDENKAEENHVVIDFGSEETAAGLTARSLDSVTITNVSLEVENKSSLRPSDNTSNRTNDRSNEIAGNETSTTNRGDDVRSWRMTGRLFFWNGYLTCRRKFMLCVYGFVYILGIAWKNTMFLASAVCVPFTGTIDPRTSGGIPCEEKRLEDILSVGVACIYQRGEKLWYCGKCDIFRPLRAKHCNDCGYCVRTYDHHCPWIGVCVGERNRGWFCFFLVLQSIELTYAIIMSIVATIVDSDWLEKRNPTVEDIVPHVYLMFMMVIMFSLVIMTFSLAVFHIILIFANTTTWELTSWMRISYLKRRDRSRGSPFGTSSLKENVCLALQIPGPLLGHWDPGKLSHLGKYVVGLNNELFWLPAHPEGTAMPPKLLANACCNLFELCA